MNKCYLCNKVLDGATAPVNIVPNQQRLLPILLDLALGESAEYHSEVDTCCEQCTADVQTIYHILERIGEKRAQETQKQQQICYEFSTTDHQVGDLYNAHNFGNESFQDDTMFTSTLDISVDQADEVIECDFIPINEEVRATANSPTNEDIQTNVPVISTMNSDVIVFPAKRLRRPPKRYREDEYCLTKPSKLGSQIIQLTKYTTAIPKSLFNSYSPMAQLRSTTGDYIADLIEVPHNGKLSRIRILCRKCPKAFAFQKEFHKHNMAAHGNTIEENGIEDNMPLETLYYCSKCNKAFEEHFAVRRHFKMTHSKERLFKCEQCPATFKYKYNLKYHHMSSHLNQKLHQCTQCGKRFVLRYELTIHMRLHTGEKPFKCQVCSLNFAYRSNMVQHRLIHKHANFRCLLCKASFSKRYYLQRHEKRIHRQPLYEHNISTIDLENVYSQNIIIDETFTNLNLNETDNDTVIADNCKLSKHISTLNMTSPVLVTENHTLPYTLIDNVADSSAILNMPSDKFIKIDDLITPSNKVQTSTPSSAFAKLPTKFKIIKIPKGSETSFMNQISKVENQPHCIKSTFDNFAQHEILIEQPNIMSSSNTQSLQTISSITNQSAITIQQFASSKKNAANKSYSVLKQLSPEEILISTTKLLDWPDFKYSNKKVSQPSNSLQTQITNAEQDVIEFPQTHGNARSLLLQRPSSVNKLSNLDTNSSKMNITNISIEVNDELEIYTPSTAENIEQYDLPTIYTKTYKQNQFIQDLPIADHNQSHNTSAANNPIKIKTVDARDASIYTQIKKRWSPKRHPSKMLLNSKITEASHRIKTSPYSLLRPCVQNQQTSPSKPHVTKVDILPTLQLQSIQAAGSSTSTGNLMIKIPSEYKFQCPECWKYFKQSSALTKHFRTHTGSKPYQCKLCPRSYADASNYKKHKLLHTKAAETLNINRGPKPALSPALSTASDPDPDGIEVMQTIQRFESDSDEDNMESYLWQDALEHSLNNEQLREDIKRKLMSINNAIMPASTSANYNNLYTTNDFLNDNPD